MTFLYSTWGRKRGTKKGKTLPKESYFPLLYLLSFTHHVQICNRNSTVFRDPTKSLGNPWTWWQGTVSTPREDDWSCMRSEGRGRGLPVRCQRKWLQGNEIFNTRTKPKVVLSISTSVRRRGWNRDPSRCRTGIVGYSPTLRDETEREREGSDREDRFDDGNVKTPFSVQNTCTSTVFKRIIERVVRNETTVLTRMLKTEESFVGL